MGTPPRVPMSAVCDYRPVTQFLPSAEVYDELKKQKKRVKPTKAKYAKLFAVPVGADEQRSIKKALDDLLAEVSPVMPPPPVTRQRQAGTPARTQYKTAHEEFLNQKKLTSATGDEEGYPMNYNSSYPELMKVVASVAGAVAVQATAWKAVIPAPTSSDEDSSSEDSSGASSCADNGAPSGGKAAINVDDQVCRAMPHPPRADASTWRDVTPCAGERRWGAPAQAGRQDRGPQEVLH